MLEFICAIPEEIGWAIVGFTACLCVMMAVKVAKLIVRAVRERIEEMRAIVESDTPSTPDGEFR
jgi:hypothetical protein